MTTSNRQTTENLLFLTAFALALVIRLARLDSLPLSDFEASWALQALRVAQYSRPEIAPQASYLIPTAFLFFIFQANELVARLAPVIAGSLLVLSPYFFRDKFPGWTAVVLAFILALEPGLVALSRLAGGPMLAVSFTMLALGTWRTRHFAWSGFLGVLAFLSGPAFWPGVLGLCAAWLIVRDADWMNIPAAGAETTDENVDSPRSMWQPALISGGATLLGVSILFLFSSNGLNAVLGGPLAYLGGWARLGDVPFWRLLVALVAYEPFLLLFATLAAVLGLSAGDRRVAFLLAWLGVAFLLALVYPSRLVADLAWMLIPLSALAALAVARVFTIERETAWETAGVAVLTFAMLVFIHFNVLGIEMQSYPAQTFFIPLINYQLGGQSLAILMLSVAVALLILSLALVAFGWSVNVAVRGGLWGLMAAALLFTINATTSAGAIRANQVATPWSPGTQPGQQAFMLETIKDLSTLAAGSPEALDVTVYGVETPSLRWLLRDQKATYVSGLVPDSAPSVVISPDDSGLSLGSGYRGQDFVLEATPNWVTASRADWLKWLAKREMPTDSRRVILWVRSDLFMGSEETTP